MFRQQVARDLERAPEAVNLQDEAYVRKVAERMPDVVSFGGSMQHLYRAVLSSRCAPWRVSISPGSAWLTPR